MKLEDQSTVYEHVPPDGKIFIVTAAEPWSVGMINRLKKSHPDEVKITAVNKDGSLVAELPLDWMRIKPKYTKNLTDEQREKMRQDFISRVHK